MRNETNWYFYFNAYPNFMAHNLIDEPINATWVTSSQNAATQIAGNGFISCSVDKSFTWNVQRQSFLLHRFQVQKYQLKRHGRNLFFRADWIEHKMKSLRMCVFLSRFSGGGWIEQKKVCPTFYDTHFRLHAVNIMRFAPSVTLLIFISNFYRLLMRRVIAFQQHSLKLIGCFAFVLSNLGNEWYGFHLILAKQIEQLN